MIKFSYLVRHQSVETAEKPDLSESAKKAKTEETEPQVSFFAFFIANIKCVILPYFILNLYKM